MLVLPLLVVVIVVGIGVGVARARGRRVGWHNALRRVALGFALACTVFIGLFIAGAALSDPGGFAGVGLVATWLLPLVGLSLLAWYRPATAVWVLGALTGVVVAVGAWYALAPDWWRDFEDDHGPLRAIGAVALLAPMALLAWRRPVPGATLLLVIGVVPALLAFAAAGDGGAGTVVTLAGSPAVLTGMLFLVAEVLPRAHPELHAPVRVG